MRCMSRPISAAMFAALLAAAPHSASAQPAPAEARPTLLLRETVTGMPRGERQEIQVLTATIAPGQATVFHTHAFPVTVHVLEGTFTLEMEGRPTAVVQAGQAMVEPPHVRMTGYNRGTAPLRVLIVYVADPGTPFLHPVH